MTDHDDLLEGLTTPRPPGRLRARTLMAARRAATQETPAPAWRAVLEPFAARPGWIAALVLVALAHLALGRFTGGKRASPDATPRSQEVAAQPDLLRLPRVTRPVHDPLASMPDDEGGRS